MQSTFRVLTALIIPNLEDLSLPKGFVPLTEMQKASLDIAAVTALKSKRPSNELWLIKLLPNVKKLKHDIISVDLTVIQFDASTLNGQTLKFKSPSAAGHVATLSKDGTMRKESRS